MADYNVVWSGPDLRKTVEADDKKKEPIVIEIQHGIWNEDGTGKHGITRDTDIADLPEVTRRDREKYGDACRYNIFEENFQKEIHRPFRLRQDQITEVNIEEDLNRVLDEVEVAIDEYKRANPDVKYIPVGTDNERHCHTAQFSIRLPNYYIKGKDWERHILVQLQAKPNNAVYIHGTPQRLIQFLSRDDLLLIGKGIAQDARELADRLRMTREQRATIKFIKFEDLVRFMLNW